MVQNELKEKNDFDAKIMEKAQKKKDAAPSENYEEKKKKYTERSEKYNSATGGDESTKYIARRMKMRACEAMAHAEMLRDKYNVTDTAIISKAESKAEAEAKKCKASSGFSELTELVELAESPEE